MIHEEICTYEVAKLAKEKGFNVPTHFAYNENCRRAMYMELCLNRNTKDSRSISAPSQSLLQRWLREEKGIHISINYQQGVDEECPSYDYSVYRWPINTEAFVSEEWKDGYSTYELALEDALKYALENLV